ncbi:hypothetical protein MMC17_004195 [Xylographa soralifera]|nr:hypothetical protein [Xylographa soralifera]
MSFGFGLSDCLCLAELLRVTYQRCVAAGKQYEDVQDEVKKMLVRLEEVVFCLDTLHQKNIKCPNLIGTTADDCKLRVSRIKDHLSRYTSLGNSSAGLVGAKERIKWACGNAHGELLELLKKQNDDLWAVYFCFMSRMMLDVHEQISILRQSQSSSTITTQPSETVSEDEGDIWKQRLVGPEEDLMTEATFHAKRECLVAYINALKMEEVNRQLSSPPLELAGPGAVDTFPSIKPVQTCGTISTGIEELSAHGASLSAPFTLESDVEVSLNQSRENDLTVLATRVFFPKELLRNLGWSGPTLNGGYSPSSTPYLPKAFPISRNMSIAIDGSILPRQPKKRRMSGISILFIPEILNQLGSSSLSIS